MLGLSNIAQWVNSFVAKLEDLNSVPKTHIMGEWTLTSCPLTFTCPLSNVCTPYTIN